jgi:hypothetical protein
MGRVGRHKREDLAYETFDGAGCSSGLQLELWRQTTRAATRACFRRPQSGRWQATLRVREREGKKVRRDVGTFGTKGGGAVQRALAIAGYTVTWLALPCGLCAGVLGGECLLLVSVHWAKLVCRTGGQGWCQGRRLEMKSGIRTSNLDRLP